VPHLSPTTLTTAGNTRDHLVFSVALGAGLPPWEYATSLRRGNRPGPRRVVASFWMYRNTHSPHRGKDVTRVSQVKRFIMSCCNLMTNRDRRQAKVNTFAWVARALGDRCLDPGASRPRSSTPSRCSIPSSTTRGIDKTHPRSDRQSVRKVCSDVPQ